MIRMSKFYDFLRGHARIQLTDEKDSIIRYDGCLNSLPDAFDHWTVIDFDAKSDLAGEVTYRFTVRQ